MSDVVEIWERPQTENLYMIMGWRQWADAGAVSSGLPQYLIQQTQARKIGELGSDGFYLFQLPGMHDLIRPIVQFDEGYPKTLETRQNNLYYTGDGQRGTVLFLGDEPHLDIDRYTNAILDTAQSLNVKRIIILGGVYGELPYDKERSIGSSYSLPYLKKELASYAVNFSDYHGGASIGSYICRKAGERGIELVTFYAFVPMYDFSALTQRASAIRIENDFMSWLGIMRRVNYMFKTRFALADLEQKSDQLLQAVDAKVSELESLGPQLGVRDYMNRLSETFVEKTFDPLDDVWEKELRRLLDDTSSDTDDE
jgi:predicted ATP-grasp superfamily ATP-dependent carboligase